MGRDTGTVGEDGLGILTPAERRVLEYVREGTLDAEIAVRLGVPVGDVKTRIESMLRKLELRERSELATWTPGAPPPEPGPDVAEDEADVIEPESEHGFRPRLMAASSLGAIVVAVCAIAAFLAFSGGSDPDPGRPTPEPTLFSGAGSATASPVATVSTELRLGDPVDLPPDIALLYTVGEASRGDPQQLMRLRRLPTGDYTSELVFQAAQGYITRVLTRGDTQPLVFGEPTTLVVGVCEAGVCAGDARTDTSDALLAIYRSTDSGVTWTREGAVPGFYQLAGLTADSAIIYHEGADESVARWRWDPPGMMPYEGPAGATPSGEFWISNDRTRVLVQTGEEAILPPLGNHPVLSDNSLSPPPPSAKDPTYQIVAVQPAFEKGWLVRWHSYQTDEFGDAGERIGAVDGFGALHGWAVPAASDARAIVPLDSASLTALGVYDGEPALFAFAAGYVYPLRQLTGFVKLGPVVPVAIERGAWAQVAGAGDCLNVRERPDLSAPILACYPDGTWLRMTETKGPVVSGDGTMWMEVLTPDGRRGYASTDYLAWSGS